MKAGDTIFIKEFAQYAVITEVLPDGRPTRAEIMTPEGPRIVNILSLVIEAVGLGHSLYQLIRTIIKSIKYLINGTRNAKQ